VKRIGQEFAAGLFVVIVAVAAAAAAAVFVDGVVVGVDVVGRVPQRGREPIDNTCAIPQNARLQSAQMRFGN